MSENKMRTWLKATVRKPGNGWNPFQKSMVVQWKLWKFTSENANPGLHRSFFEEIR